MPANWQRLASAELVQTVGSQYLYDLRSRARRRFARSSVSTQVDAPAVGNRFGGSVQQRVASIDAGCAELQTEIVVAAEKSSDWLDSNRVRSGSEAGSLRSLQFHPQLAIGADHELAQTLPGDVVPVNKIIGVIVLLDNLSSHQPFVGEHLEASRAVPEAITPSCCDRVRAANR